MELNVRSTIVPTQAAVRAMLAAGHETMVERLVHRLKPVVDEVIVAGGASPSPMSGATVVADAYTDAGPLAGMHAGFLATACARAWVVACDLPDVEPALGPWLLRVAAGVDAVVPRLGDEPQGVCAIYDIRLAPRLEGLLASGKRRVTDLLDVCAVRYVEAAELQAVDPELRSFRNLNTPADYVAWVRSRPAPR